ncbi:MAG: hypothetical protein M3Q56_05495 [Bacteroidota bacterium]|nr:hypothetical protein [Bacteroidota bacterium]
MKSIFFSFLIVAFYTIASSFTLSHTDDHKWELLGSRTIKHGLDRDEILVTGWEGRFDAIKIKVRRSGINMHKCIVHFADGSEQNVGLKNQFSAGSESRVIDLEGNNRIIRKVVFWYDTKNFRKSKAVVELWGKH